MTLVAVERAPGRGVVPLPAAWAELARCDAHLAAHLSAALRRFGAVALGLVDLPSLDLPTLDAPGDLRPSAPELHVAAVLLWARHVDDAGLLPVVSALAEGVVSGALPLALTGAAARALVSWHRQRQEHFTLPERRALYEHLFGDPVAPQLSALIEGLAALGAMRADESLLGPRARLSVLARQVAGALSARATGMAGFAARDIVAQVREALGLLAQPELAAALGGGSPWVLVARHAPSLLQRRVDPEAAIARASAGRAVLAYLAEHVAELVAGTLAPSPADPVVHAAATYAANAAPGGL